VSDGALRPEKVWLLCGLAMVGFAANSLLSRLALRPQLIDPGSFAAVRLGTGAVALLLLSRLRGASAVDGQHGSWPSALWLLSYVLPFTWAYERIGAGIGALILFGAVQATMIGWGVARGERPGAREWLGLALALSGLGLLTLPGATRPDLVGLGLMIVAGVAWGAYSLRGRGSRDPLAATTGNFVRSAPLGAAAWIGARLIGGPDAWHAEREGLVLAAASGALASGVGYALWYAALPGLRAVQAALVQLSVPVLAAGAAVVLLDEALSLRLVSAGVLVLGGVLLALRAPGRG
jgi:drug/metabolite transporter (DMT)-like permease